MAGRHLFRGRQRLPGVFEIDAYADLTPEAASSRIGVPAFNGVAISEADEARDAG